MFIPRVIIMMASGLICFSTSAAHASGTCGVARNLMERAICADPAIAARDAAMNQLYRVDLSAHGAASRESQRKWLAGAIACRTAECLKDKYDERNAALLRRDGGRRVARRFHLEFEGRNGDLLVFERNGWITYDATETVIGPGGEAAGDVSAARMQGTARLSGALAREEKSSPPGCAILLQHNGDGSWSMETRHCFESDRADLNDRFLAVR